MPQERAFGAALIAVVIGIVGFLTIVFGAIVLIASAIGWGFGAAPATGTFLGFVSTNAVIVSVAVIILGLIYLAVASGLWNQRYWALIVMFVVGVLYIVGQLSGLIWGFFYATPTFSLTNADVIGTIVGVIVVAGVLAYLTAVRDDFI
ncbi:MAG: hypothetical protein ACREB9_04605 [Thermoplasmata archaeon]